MLPDRRWRFVGSSDPPLSQAGIDQAHSLAERLRPVRFDSIHSSDLQRSLMTAKIIAAHNAVLPAAVAPADAPPKPYGAESVEVDPRLREIDAGRWELLTIEEAAARFPKEYEERERDLVGFRFPGGESFRDLRERVVPAFLDIVGRGGANILIVAHLGVNRVLLSEFLGLPPEKLFSIKQEYGGLSLLSATTQRDGSRRIRVISLPGRLAD